MSAAKRKAAPANALAKPAPGFDYKALGKSAGKVRGVVEAVRALDRRMAHDWLEIGRLLAQAKELLGHGLWGAWLKAEFGWSQDTAGRYMKAADAVRQHPQIADFGLSAVYVFTDPRTPEAARRKMLAAANGGQKVTRRLALTAVEEAKPKAARPETIDAEFTVQAAGLTHEQSREVIRLCNLHGVKVQDVCYRFGVRSLSDKRLGFEACRDYVVEKGAAAKTKDLPAAEAVQPAAETARPPLDPDGEVSGRRRGLGLFEAAEPPAAEAPGQARGLSAAAADALARRFAASLAAGEAEVAPWKDGVPLECGRCRHPLAVADQERGFLLMGEGADPVGVLADLAEVLAGAGAPVDGRSVYRLERAIVEAAKAIAEEARQT